MCHRFLIALLAGPIVFFAGCATDDSQTVQKTPQTMAPDAQQNDGAPEKATLNKPGPAAWEVSEDQHSFSHPDQARVKHVSLNLNVDFSKQILKGEAELLLDVTKGANQVILDTRDLQIEKILDHTGAPLAFILGEAQGFFGQALTVSITDSTPSIVVHYQTSPGAGALQWLSPEQTRGGKKPYLFTQGQAILTRTYIPLQDSPAVRITYDAEIRVPADLKAIMSAEMKTQDGVQEGEHRVFRFHMPEAIPPYLIALAVGDLAFRALGPRTGVYTEPADLDRAHHEFADIEKMMDTVEALYGSYRWSRYDILVLPPSFPFGGMENPRLTFLSPTVIAGDRSLVSVLAHELAHSWSGNLVTNQTWSDFWLNEGFTTYIENRILEEIYGIKYAKMVEAIGRRDLHDEVASLGADSTDTSLYQPLEKRDPDEAITSIPYDKGSAFLRLLENSFGRDAFDSFLKRYFDENAFTTMTTKRFLSRLRAELVKGDEALEAQLQLNQWAYGTGIPDNIPAVESPVLPLIAKNAEAFGKGEKTSQTIETKDFGALEWVLFLRALPRSLTQDQLRDLDEAHGFSKTGNAEIRCEWLLLVVHNQYESAYPSLENFLMSQGRRKLVRPLFQQMVENQGTQALAKRIYEKARPRYHPLTAETLDGIFEKAGIHRAQ
jgi:leukotriene-A4 hydrolase